jgi:hypothetical protein
VLDNGGWFDYEPGTLDREFLAHLRTQLKSNFSDREMLRFLLLVGSARGDDYTRIAYETKDSDLNYMFDSIE